MHLESDLSFVLKMTEEDIRNLRCICNKAYGGPYGRGIPEDVEGYAVELSELLCKEMSRRGFII